MVISRSVPSLQNQTENEEAAAEDVRELWAKE